MRYAIAALIPTLLLAACAPVRFDTLACPDVVLYSPAVQKQAADEIEAGAAPVLTEMVKDYSVMRDQSRVCKNGGK